MAATDEPVVVIGSGVAGLTAACTLAERGIDTLVLEKNDSVGGCNSAYMESGYSFDVGATMLHTPDVLRDAFASFGAELDEHLQLVALDPLYRIAFADGTALDLTRSVEGMADRISKFSSRDAKGFLRYIDDMARFKKTLKRLLIDRSPTRMSHHSTDVLRLFSAFNPARSVGGMARRYFRTRHMRTAFTFQVLYWGVPPNRCPAVYGMIPYFEVTKGVWHVRGGLHSISAALARIFREKGGSIRLGAAVEGVDVSRGEVRGVRLAGGETIKASAVISNADALYTYRQLVPQDVLPSLLRARLRRFALSSAPRVALLGIKGRSALRGLPHHTFMTPVDINDVCHQIFDLREPPSPTYAYLCVPTATDATMAPPDRTALYALALLPHRLRHQSWEDFRQGVVKGVLSELQRRGIANGALELDLEKVLLPPDFEQTFNQPSGMGFGIRSTLRQMGPLRFAARSPNVRGLYLAGASTNPGAGLPLVTASGRTAADALLSDRASPRRSARAGQRRAVGQQGNRL